MQNLISKKLWQIQLDNKVRVLYACESGSRAWGFASSNSDYDVRFIYCHEAPFYMTINAKYDETIENEVDDNGIDSCGWEIRKALRLFSSSNPQLMEWLNSPIEYVNNGILVNSMRAMTQRAFSPRTAAHHYLNMSKQNFMQYLNHTDPVWLKKYLYCIRTVAALQWVDQYGTVPPVAMSVLLSGAVKHSGVISAVNQLIQDKMNGSELDLGLKIDTLDRYIITALNKYDQQNGGLNHFPESSGVTVDELNTLCVKAIQEAI